MICRHCQTEVQDLPFCPHCGYRLDGRAAYPPQEDNPHGEPSRRVRRRRFLRRWVYPLAFLLVIIAFGIMGLILVGFQEGLRDHDLASQHQAEIHYNRGLVYLEWGQYQLAEAEFEEAVRLVPNYHDAEENRRIAQVRQTVTPTTTPSPTPTATATPVIPTPTTEVVVIPVTEVLFKEGQSYYEKKEWQQAISTLEQLRSEDIDYQTEQVTEMLFQSRYQYGVELDEQGMLEAAISQFNHALDLRPRHPQVEMLRRRADLYQSALDLWNVNWQSAVNYLTALYALAPDYKDAADRLYQASTTYARVLVKEERYCAAAELFEQALQIDDTDAEIVELEDDSHHLCQVTTPKPLAGGTPDGPTQAETKVHIGTLAATCYDVRTDQYNICAQDAEEGVLYTWIEQAEQPALTIDAKRLAYRSTAAERPGLYAVDIISDSISGDPITITTEIEAYYPSWSSDGTRVTYMQYDQDKEEWSVYVAHIGGGEAPLRIRQGEWPAWGPGEWLAMTTCGGENDCGIYTLNLASGTMRRLTQSRQDRAAAWSPSGDEIAYTSDIGRSLNLYVVHAQSGYVRQITMNLFTDVLPTWSPDGQRIAYVTNRDDQWVVFTTHPYPQGGQETRIATLGAESADWLRFRLSWVTPIVRIQ